jgi:hypothetical protein
MQNLEIRTGIQRPPNCPIAQPLRDLLVSGLEWRMQLQCRFPPRPQLRRLGTCDLLSGSR